MIKEKPSPHRRWRQPRAFFLPLLLSSLTFFTTPSSAETYPHAEIISPAPQPTFPSAATLSSPSLGTHGDGSAEGTLSILVRHGLLTAPAAKNASVSMEIRERTSGIVVSAMGLIGIPYKWGGNSIETGFDCSGLVQSLYEKSVGLILPRKAEHQAAATKTIHKNDLRPGDLVFFNTMRRSFSHVGIYVGEGRFIHAPRTGASIRIDEMKSSYWSKRFNGARRVPIQTAESSQSGD